MFAFELDGESQLKILEAQHAQELFALTDASRGYLRQWLPWLEFTKSVADTEKFIAMTRRRFADNNGFQAGIWHQGKIAGCVGFHAIDWPNQSTSIGYWLGEGFQGMGLMTKGCRALIEHAFSEYKLQRIEIRCATANVKSRAIPERLGFVHEGTLRRAEKLPETRFVDLEVYGLLVHEWTRR